MTWIDKLKESKKILNNIKKSISDGDIDPTKNDAVLDEMVRCQSKILEVEAMQVGEANKQIRFKNVEFKSKL